MSAMGTGRGGGNVGGQGRARAGRRPRRTVGRRARPRAAAAGATSGACWRCCGPTACAWRRCCSRWCSGHARRWPRRCWRGSRSTRASPSTTRKCSRFVVGAFLLSAILVWGATHAQTYLVGWVGQRALADLRIRIFTHLQRQPIGFYESRPAGVLISRITNDVEALESLVTDSVVTLFQAGLTLIGAIAVLVYLDPQLALLTFCIVPFVAGGQHLVPAGVGRRLPAHAGDDRVDHGLPAGDAVGHPRGPQLRPGARPRDPLRRAQRGQPRGQHDHRPPQRDLLPGGGNDVRRGARADRPVRGLPGDQRPHHRGHDRRLRGHAVVPVRTDPAALPALHHLPVGDGRAGEDLRAARRRADPAGRAGGEGPRADPRGDQLRGRVLQLPAACDPAPAKAAPRRRSPSAAAPATEQRRGRRPAEPALALEHVRPRRSRPGRRSPWWEPPGPASPRWRSSPPASTTPPRDGCWWTDRTCER